MSHLSYITAALDEAVEEALGATLHAHGIAVLSAEVNETGTVAKVSPVVFDERGEGIEANPDDADQAGSYHRALSVIVGKVPQGRFGDGTGYDRHTTRMSMVLWAKRTAVKMAPEDVSLVLAASLPEQVQDDKLPGYIQNVKISLNEVVLNPEQVFNEEYKGVPFFINPEYIYLKANYTIESTLDKRCFTTC